jgi:hypothetical protein
MKKQTSRDGPAVRDTTGKASGWAIKIDVAKRARSDAITARKGKRATFTSRTVMNPTTQ